MDRILPVFEKNYPLESRDAVWNNCMDVARTVELNEFNLENMASTPLVSGFGGKGGMVEIIRLAEALGVCGIGNPENDAFCGKRIPPHSNLDGLNVDEMLDKIQAALPFPIDFPPFSGNCLPGIQTKYGVTSNRNIFYLWVVKRILELCPYRNAGVIEIGAGFGVLGYYLSKLGYLDYTTIDLALVNACQTYFLAKNLPHRHIILSGEVPDPFDNRRVDSIKLLHSTDFKKIPTGRFLIMVNMDGLTEYGIGEATKYIQYDCAEMLFSINHEANPFSVCEIPQHRKRQYRYPFWLRPGYVEELYV